MAEFSAPDICVIGAGAGGLAVATGARASGASVVLIEKRAIGGDAFNSSSLAARALAAAARRANYLRTAAPFGIANDEPKINARGVFDHVHAVVEGVAADVTAERLRAQGIELITAEARFVDRKTVEAGDRLIRARHFVIATGSKPVIPEIAGLDSVPYFTSATIFDNPRKLTHLVIIGGGSVGIELAQAFRRLGGDVTVVDIATPLADRDPELVEIALRRLIDEGVAIRPDTTVTGVQMRSLGIGVSIRSGDGVEEVLDASHILVATGRLPNLDGIELLKGGMQWYQKNGSPHLLLRRGLRTSNRRIYAVGDVAGGEQYTQTAIYQARLVVQNALFGLPRRNDPSRVPSAIFTDPELAEIGLTEPEARRKRGDDYRVLRYSFAENDRARVERETYGLVKLITDRSGKLLGAGIVGTGAAEMISLFALAIGNGLSISDFRNFVAPYPTLTEIAQNLAGEATRETAGSPIQRRLMAVRRRLPWL